MQLIQDENEIRLESWPPVIHNHINLHSLAQGNSSVSIMLDNEYK